MTAILTPIGELSIIVYRRTADCIKIVGKHKTVILIISSVKFTENCFRESLFSVKIYQVRVRIRVRVSRSRVRVRHK